MKVPREEMATHPRQIPAPIYIVRAHTQDCDYSCGTTGELHICPSRHLIRSLASLLVSHVHDTPPAWSLDLRLYQLRFEFTLELPVTA